MTPHYILPLLAIVCLFPSVSFARTLIQYEITTNKGCKVISYQDTSKPDSQKITKAIWDGSCRSGYAEGDGTLVTENGETKTNSNGRLVKGKWEGEVTQEILKKDGSKGTAKVIFVGGLENGYGEGSMTTASGASIAYSGQFKDGHPNGAGKLTTAKSTLSGEFQDGVPVGVVTLASLDGKVTYTGFIKNRKPHGAGKLTTPSSSITGEFSEGFPVGIVTLTPTNGNWTYEGNLLKGKPDGKGTFTFKNNVKITINIQNDKPDSVGKIEYANGDIYEGELIAMKPEGKGKFSSPNGTWTEGIFKNGRPEGDGVLSNKNGTFEVTFIDGKPTKRNSSSPSQYSAPTQSNATPQTNGWEVLGNLLEAFAVGYTAANQVIQNQTPPAGPSVIYVPTPQQPSVPQNTRTYCKQAGNGVACNSY